MKFRTECPPPSYPFVLSPSRPAVALGSCFAANIALRMQQCLWKAWNPGGTLFNPASVAAVLRAMLSGRAAEAVRHTCFNDGSLWRSWWGDSSLAGASPEEVTGEFARRAQVTQTLLPEAEALIVTFGTAWVYELLPLRSIVANCHRQPAHKFSRRQLSCREITETWLPLLTSLADRFPRLKVIFTVSPVRHVKDGLHANNLSKATLLLAVEQICLSAPNAFYFPAYEIVCDDLRDYRFYAPDLVHPSQQAVDYIWEIFRLSLLDDTGRRLLREGEEIAKGWSHRPNSAVSTPQLAEDERTRKGRILDRYALLCGEIEKMSGTLLGVMPLEEEPGA